MDEIRTPIDPEVPVSEKLESASSPDSEFGRAAKGPPRVFDLKLFFGLLAASLVGSLAIIPYSMTLIKRMDLHVPEALVPLAMALTVVVELAVSAPAIALGLWLGPRVGLARLFVRDDCSAVESGVVGRIWEFWGKPLAIGMALGALMGFYAWRMDSSGGGKDHALTRLSPWEGLLASIGAGVREEIVLRLGLMTFLVWLGFRLVAHLESRSVIIWIANLLAALSFAAIHIPQAYFLFRLNVPMIVFIFVGNGVPGLVFGWLYWRRGLVAAILAHFGLDLVLKVLMPLWS